MKKFLAVLLALTLTLSLGITAFATNVADSNTPAAISVSGIETGAAVDAYKIIDVNYNTTSGTVTGASFAPNVQTWMNGTSYSSATIQSLHDADASVQKAFYTDLAHAIKAGTVVLAPTSLTQTGTGTGDPATYTYASASNAATMGQYLVIVSGTSSYIYQPVTANLLPSDSTGVWTISDQDTPVIDAKRTTIDITKTASDTTLGYGDTVTFTLNAGVPQNAADSTKTLSVADTMSAGLTYSGNLTITGYATSDAATGTDISSAATTTNWFATAAPTASRTGTISFAHYADIMAYDHIVITYTATLNEKAVVNTAESNTATLTWDKFSKTVTTPISLYTYGLQITKQNEKGGLLTGAVFTIEKKGADDSWTYLGEGHGSTTTDTTNGHYIWTSDANGALSVERLDEGTYRYTEIKAPNGYNLLTAPVQFVIAKDATNAANVSGKTNGYQTATVVNYSKLVLPSTGGMGTTIFTVLGALIVLTSGLFLALNRKRIFGK